MSVAKAVLQLQWALLFSPLQKKRRPNQLPTTIPSFAVSAGHAKTDQSGDLRVLAELRPSGQETRARRGWYPLAANLQMVRAVIRRGHVPSFLTPSSANPRTDAWLGVAILPAVWPNSRTSATPEEHFEPHGSGSERSSMREVAERKAVGCGFA